MTDTTAPAAPALTLEEKRLRLASLLQKKVAEPKVYPTSFLQQRLWFLDLLEPGSIIYNLSGALRMTGRLDGDALDRALNEVVRRHESLRTSIRVRDGESEPVQVVDPALRLAVGTTDLSDVPEGDERQAALDRALEAFVREPFVLAEAPLLRVRLFRESPTSHVLVLAMHHVISDGWSISILVSELETLYEAFRAGKPSPLAPLKVQYGDFARWQREHFQGGELARQLAFWKEQLQGAPAVLDLPFDRPRPATQEYAGASIQCAIGAELTASIQALARKEGATPFMLLLAAFGVLLHRYTGQTDVVVGTPIAGRTRPELEPIFGYFANTLALRTRMEGDPTFLELLQRTRTTMLGAYAHQDFPFEKLVDELKLERSLSYNPLFQILFALQNAGVSGSDELAMAGMELEGVAVDGGTTIFDMAWQMHESGDQYVAVVEYKTGLLDDETVKAMGRHYRQLLTAVAADPGRPISHYDILSDDERERLLTEWTGTGREYPSGLCVHQAFAAQARRTPGAVAVSFAGTEITYAELDARANRLAHRLRRMGVRADVPVAISVERSPEMVVALLGVLKAGGAYLPVDPAYPADRRAYMVADAGAGVILTQAHLVAGLPPGGAAVLRLDADWESVAEESADEPDSGVTPDNLAYVIYTSGSTGRPKGVMVPHRGVLNLVQAQNEAFRIDSGSRVLQFASFSFDAAVSEVLTALLAGARLHLAPQEALMPGDPLLATLRDERISVVTLPPSALAVMPHAELPDLRTLVSAGEACPVEVPQRWAPGRHFVNAYGPTETTVCATLSPEDGTRRPRIGRPIDNVRVYVLDAGLRLAPAGVPGEVCVAGAGVAAGYHGRAALTASSFVPDPFGAEPGARLYRTGDRARWHDDGTLEYLGRVDDQVKVRGFRIELGEIESALRAHPAVADAAVVAREGAGGDRRLAAYVVLRAGASAASAELRAHLQGTLPEYMVPAGVAVMDAFPLTPNGKVDRAALPAADGQPAERAPYAPPRTPAELAMAEIWAEVLGVHPVGIHDDFFALGGHSLLATRVVTRVRRSLGVDVALRNLFESPTIAGLSQHLHDGGDAAAAPPITPADRSRPLPLSFAQERLWFVDRLVPGSIAYNMPVVLPVHGAPVETVRRVLDEVVARHETLRTTFADVGGNPAQRVAAPGPVPLHVMDLSGMDEAERAGAVPRIISEELNRPFNLERGPLFRATLLRVSDQEQVLAMVMHHIVSDAWSVDVLTAEVRTLLAAFVAGEPSPLPPLTLQYADFAVWQRAWLSGDELERQAAYWKQALAGIPEALELPTDRPRPAVQTFGGRTVARPLPRALVRRLNALGREQGVTTFMTVLAAFSVVLGRWSGQDDVVIGSPMAGRNRGETEPLIGFFVNNLVMRTDLSGAPSFRTLLGRVRDVTLGAYAHEDLPFERLVEALDVPRSTSHTPIFQVLFNLLTPQDVPGGGAEMPDEVTEMDEPAKYDLSLTVADLGADMGATLNFNVDLFDAATIRRMMAHFVSVLEQVTAAPDLSIADIDLLPGEERALVVGEWNDTTRPYPTGLRIHDLFESQVRATPDAPALVFAGDTLTYAELNTRANRLAHHLAALGVGPEVRVGVAMERTPDLIVALLAVLKAGGAYVPVDPAYPADRIAYMLEDSGAAVVLTQARVASNLPATAARVVSVDTDAEAIASQSAENPVAASTPQNAAYAIYTSGSTGRPKGVVIEHRSTVVVLQWLKETVTDEERSSSLGSTSISFDVSIAEIFGTLCWGGKLVLVENALSLAELGEKAGIRLATMVPSAAQVLLRMGGIPSTVRSFNLGGEPLPNALAQALYRTGTVEKVLNLYGPTEDTTYSTWSLVEEGGAKVYVGRPVANTQTYVVDAALRPVPIGVPGELYLAGDGLSRGYLNRPALTAERYIPNPFGPAGSRMYRVGDLTRYLADGTIEYLGRLDHQVKIRGFRIEIGEVEAALAAHPSMQDAAVVARESDDGDRRLVAYLVAKPGAALEVGEVRGHLKARLPEHMVPSAFVVLDALPLTPNGKVDRRALPAPDLEAARESVFVAAEGDMEEELATIWAAVLGVERVGMNDNFFEIGGHSLLLAQVQAQLKDTLGREVAMVDLFRFPTIRALCAHLGEGVEDTTAERGQARAEARRAARGNRRGRR